ncbi:acyl-CoA thioesterase YbgC [Rubripirellula tenax]|uniref:Acyl-CoA thioesterase YbgC n=1 Tax=Rubripirellula tenax TaxID=2528015 RepID=A0A5C6FKS2_9BACT|nr:acyl-CoA thioesterase [Rubripirellula tenax]TWU60607.1 acyl-CoA thioesterase YbgC [Rubripirellula tenax]
MTTYFDFHHTVPDEEIDAQGHVHNLRYLQWTLWAASAHTAAIGFDSKAALAAGFGWVVRRHDVTYKAAALAGDEVVVRTWISELDRISSWRQSVISRPADQKILARVATRWVYVDLRVHKVVSIPTEATAGMTLLSSSPGSPWETTPGQAS